MVITLLTHVVHMSHYRFGTFIYNCHHERVLNNVFTDTLPLLAHINATRDTFINSTYRETKEVNKKLKSVFLNFCSFCFLPGQYVG